MVCALLHQFIGANRNVTHYQLIRRYLLHASVVHLDGDEITTGGGIHPVLIRNHTEHTTNGIAFRIFLSFYTYVIDIAVLVRHSLHLLLRFLRCLLTELRLPVLLHLLGFLCCLL